MIDIKEEISKMNGDIDGERETEKEPHPPQRFRDIANGE
ncbi:MAG: hypothetical protein RLZZ196_207 [Bacteroidota bacterium]|jgi:hypothetical protein